MNNLMKNPEYILGIGFILIIFNYIYEPARDCVNGIWMTDTCPDKNLTFIAIVLIVLGIILINKKKK